MGSNQASHTGRIGERCDSHAESLMIVTLKKKICVCKVKGNLGLSFTEDGTYNISFQLWAGLPFVPVAVTLSCKQVASIYKML